MTGTRHHDNETAEVDLEANIDLSWLLDDLATRLPGMVGAALTTTDGLTRFSTMLDRDSSERIGATASGLYSLARNVGPSLGQSAKSAIKQAFLETDSHWVFVMGAARGTLLTVVVSPDTDAGLVAHEMTLFISSMRTHLATPARQLAEAQSGDGGQ